MIKTLLSKNEYRSLLRVELYVCDEFKVDRDELYSNRRDHAYVVARWVVWYLLVEKFKIPASSVGRAYKRSHTTILHGVKQIKKKDWEAELEKQLKAFWKMPK